jgi:hypothetical protein
MTRLLIRNVTRKELDRRVLKAAQKSERPFLVQCDVQETWADLKAAPPVYLLALGVKLPGTEPVDAHIEWFAGRRRFVRVWRNGEMIHDEVKRHA